MAPLTLCKRKELGEGGLKVFTFEHYGSEKTSQRFEVWREILWAENSSVLFLVEGPHGQLSSSLKKLRIIVRKWETQFFNHKNYPKKDPGFKWEWEVSVMLDIDFWPTK